MVTARGPIFGIEIYLAKYPVENLPPDMWSIDTLLCALTQGLAPRMSHRRYSSLIQETPRADKSSQNNL